MPDGEAGRGARVTDQRVNQLRNRHGKLVDARLASEPQGMREAAVASGAGTPAERAIAHVRSFDPTPAGTYAEWLLTRWLRGAIHLEDLPAMRDLLRRFEARRPTLPEKDINAYAGPPDLAAALPRERPKEDPGCFEGRESELRNPPQAAVLLDDGRFLVVRPLTREAAQYWGWHTGRGHHPWCVSWGVPGTPQERYANRFDAWRTRGPFLFFFDLSTSSAPGDFRSAEAYAIQLGYGGPSVTPMANGSSEYADCLLSTTLRPALAGKAREAVASRYPWLDPEWAATADEDAVMRLTQATSRRRIESIVPMLREVGRLTGHVGRAAIRAWLSLDMSSFVQGAQGPQGFSLLAGAIGWEELEAGTIIAALNTMQLDPAEIPQAIAQGPDLAAAALLREDGPTAEALSRADQDALERAIPHGCAQPGTFHLLPARPSPSMVALVSSPCGLHCHPGELRSWLRARKSHLGREHHEAAVAAGAGMINVPAQWRDAHMEMALLMASPGLASQAADPLSRLNSPGAGFAGRYLADGQWATSLSTAGYALIGGSFGRISDVPANRIGKGWTVRKIEPSRRVADIVARHQSLPGFTLRLADGIASVHKASPTPKEEAAMRMSSSSERRLCEGIQTAAALLPRAEDLSALLAFGLVPHDGHAIPEASLPREEGTGGLLWSGAEWRNGAVLVARRGNRSVLRLWCDGQDACVTIARSASQATSAALADGVAARWPGRKITVAREWKPSAAPEIAGLGIAGDGRLCALREESVGSQKRVAGGKMLSAWWSPATATLSAFIADEALAVARLEHLGVVVRKPDGYEVSIAGRPAGPWMANVSLELWYAERILLEEAIRRRMDPDGDLVQTKRR